VWKKLDWRCSYPADTVITPELFANCLCNDFSVPSHHFVPKIVAAIRARVFEYQNQVLPVIRNQASFPSQGQLNPEGDDDQRAMVAIFNQIRDASEGGARLSDSETEESEEVKTDNGDEAATDVTVLLPDDWNDVDDVEGPMTVEEMMACLPTDDTEELRVLIKVSRSPTTSCL
jgi:SWI/SNF-related matrix-associated actin-dependent regulator of chromatin subfamily B protein 1